MTTTGGRRREAPPVHRGAARTFAVAAILAVLIATLTPGDPTVPPFNACIICGSQGVADAICNIALFAPVGAAIVFLGVRPSRAVLAAAALSAFVECMQATVIPGRDPSLGDVIFNTVGGTLGVLAAHSAASWAAPSGRRGRLFAGTAIFSACAIVGLTGLLLQPAFDRTFWYGQWTANFGNMEVYRGSVLDAQVGGRLVPSRRLNDDGAAREALLEGQPLLLKVSSSPPTKRISAIFSVYDDRRVQQFLLGASGTSLDLFVRRRVNDFRLVNPPLRFENALSGVAGGDTIGIEVRRAGITWCAGRIPSVPCLGYSAGIGWDLLQDISFLRRHALVANALWLMGLLVPAGFWLRGRNGIVGGVAAVALVCVVAPAMSGLVVSPPLEWLGAAFGLLVGAALAALLRQRFFASEFTRPPIEASTRR